MYENKQNQSYLWIFLHLLPLELHNCTTYVIRVVFESFLSTFWICVSKLSEVQIVIGHQMFVETLSAVSSRSVTTGSVRAGRGLTAGCTLQPPLGARGFEKAMCKSCEGSRWPLVISTRTGRTVWSSCVFKLFTVMVPSKHVGFLHEKVASTPKRWKNCPDGKNMSFQMYN